MRGVGWSLLLQGCIVQQLLDEVNVGQEHPAATVTLQTQSIQCITKGGYRWNLTIIQVVSLARPYFGTVIAPLHFRGRFTQGTN